MALTESTGTATAAGTAARAGSAAGLAVLAIAQFLIALDYSIVYVALPSVGADLHLSETTVQWVVSGYAVFFAGFLVVGGRASDRLGPRRLFISALVLFGVASLIGGLAQEPAMLLVARGAQGVAAAVLQPAIIALINTSFAPGAARNRALAVWGTVGASGLAAGVIIGGALTTLSWRWVFFINLPLCLLCALAAPKFLVSDTEQDRKRVPLNVVSAVICTATVLSLAIGLTLAAGHGWGATNTVVALAVGAVLLAAFVLRERRSTGPLVDPLLRRTRSLLVGCGATALYMASVGNEFYVVTLYLQQERGYLPLAAGLAFLPLALAITAGNAIAGRIVGPLGVRRCLALAFTVDAVGLFLLATQVHGDSYVLNLLPGLVISGLGHGLTYTSMFIAGTQDIEDRNQGTGGALMTTAQYLAGAVGVAILVLVLGPDPAAGRFGWAFAATAIAATAGIALAWFGLRQRADADRTPAAKA